MKPACLIGPLITVILFITSCGERKNPSGNPPKPYQIVAEIPPVGIFRGLSLNGANSFIAGDYKGLLRIDLSNPASPGAPLMMDTTAINEIVFSCQFFPASNHIFFIGDNGSNTAVRCYKYIPDDSASLVFFTGSGPSQFLVREITHIENDSTVVDSIIIHYLDNTGGERGLYTKTYVPRGGGYFRLQDEFHYDYPYGLIYDFTISDDGTIGYLAVDEFGMAVIDIFNETYIGGFDSEGFCRGITVYGDYCYMADRYWGLQILDVSDPANPQRTANLRFGASRDCEVVKACGSRVAALDIYDGVFAVDVSDPANPKTIFNFDTATPTDIEITEDYIFIIDEDAGLIIAAW